MAAILLEYLGHPTPSVRVVAVQALSACLVRDLAKDPGKKIGDPEAAREVEKKIARLLLERTLEEEHPAARSALGDALMKLRPREYFQLALAVVVESQNALHRDRAAGGIVFALRKSWVPETIAALPKTPPGINTGGNPAVRWLLEKVFQQDFGYDSQKWEAWWKANAHRYIDN